MRGCGATRQPRRPGAGTETSTVETLHVFSTIANAFRALQLDMGRSMTAGSTTQRAWQRMLSGRRLNLLDPSPLDVEIEDIAHGLARVARWNGQTIGDFAFSVAQHSLIVEEIFRAAKSDAPAADCLAALLHDAPEYVIGDIISPFKGAIGADYKAVESGLQAAIHIRFGLPPVAPKALKERIKVADRIAAYSEAVELAGFTTAEARRVLGYRRREKVGPLTALSPNDAKKAFLERFAILTGSGGTGSSNPAQLPGSKR